MSLKRFFFFFQTCDSVKRFKLYIITLTPKNMGQLFLISVVLFSVIYYIKLCQSLANNGKVEAHSLVENIS